MEHRRSRKHQAKLRRGRGATAALGCCLAAATTSVTAMDVPSYRVTPSDAPRKNMEERRRLEQDYYRHLASRQHRAEGGVGGEADTDVSANSIQRDGEDQKRRLYSSGLHKKNSSGGGSEAQSVVHEKNSHGDKSSEDNEEEPTQFVSLGSANSSGSGQSSVTVMSSNDPVSPVADLRAATNLRSFTRIGGSGYTLPDSKRYPYMASLQLEGHSPSSGKYDIHMCGAVLVAPDLFLSAAHCAHYSPEGTDETYRAFNGIEIGKVDLTDEGEPFDPYDLDTYDMYYENLVPEEDGMFLHPRFNEDTYEHDVMLVKVYGKSRFPPVKLGKSDNVELDEVTVLGWGADSANSAQKYSNSLKEADMSTMSLDQCRNINVEVTDPYSGETSRMSMQDHVFDDMMCARSSSRYICHGDAGGPAIKAGENSDEDEVQAILSWGYGCVDPDYPAVMTKISKNYGFIRGIICTESADPPAYYNCPAKDMVALSGGPQQVVTLKLKMDRQAVETGFVIEAKETGEVVAQRQVGHWLTEQYGNEIVKETMELPKNQCYILRLLDSFGDGFCCNMGGGKATLYWGTDVGYYTGQQIIEVNGNFEFESNSEFCLTGGMTSNSNGPPPSPTPKYVSNNNSPPRTPRPSRTPTTRRPTHNLSPGGSSSVSDAGANQGGTLGWDGPSTNPEFDYCTQFCRSSSVGKMCGAYACILIAQEDDGKVVLDVGNAITANLRDTPAPTPKPTDSPVRVGPIVSDEFLVQGSDYYLNIQIQFDDHPEEISWVLYDLTVNEVRVFVDFEEYPREEYANQLLEIGVTVDGPDLGEKQYAFTVYDKASNGLCCDHGDGYYKVYLGDVQDDLVLLGDEQFEFSSSYYFTLFEMEGKSEELLANDTPARTPKPTRRPSPRPTKRPTPKPSPRPTRRTERPADHSTRPPTNHPTTAQPTEAWERKRIEDADAIGARWNIRSQTPPGVFNDLGGDQVEYKFNTVGILQNAAVDPRGSSFRLSLCTAIVLMCAFVF